MPKALTEMTDAEFQTLVQKTVDERLSVWFIQLMDALTRAGEEDMATLRPEFAESLNRSIEQAAAGELTDLETFRQTLGE